MKHKLIWSLALAFAGIGASPPAAAQAGSSWILKGGLGYAMPAAKSGELGPPSVANSRIDIDNAATFLASLVYVVNSHVAVELVAGIPFEHDLSGAGATEGIGKLGSVKAASPALILQYRLGDRRDPMRLYGGIGYTYVRMHGEEGSSALTAITNPGGPPTRLDVENTSGPVLQIGASFEVNDRWSLDASLVKAFFETTTRLSTGQSIDVKVDPLVATFMLGYRF